MNNIETDVIEVNQYILKHKKELNIELGKNLKEIRLKRGITLEEMSALTQMAPTYIAQLENGSNGLSLNKFIIICNALKINTQEILRDFLFVKKASEDILFEELQNGKNISNNIIEFVKRKE